MSCGCFVVGRLIVFRFPIAFALVRLGKRYLDTGDYKHSEHYYTLASKAGAASAWHGLGRIALHHGNPKQAFKYFQIASQKGSIMGLNALAKMQFDSHDCAGAWLSYTALFGMSPQVTYALRDAWRHWKNANATAALIIYERLALAGIEEAQANAAYIHHVVRGSFDDARLFYEMSAESGSPHSYVMLGNDYFSRQDYNKSHAAYLAATKFHSHEAMYNLGYMYHHGLGVQSVDPFLAKRYYGIVPPAAQWSVD